jgi:cytochrome c
MEEPGFDGVGRAARRGRSNVAQRAAGAVLVGSVVATGCGRQDAANPPPADPVATLARQRACLNCHAIDRKLVGPSFADVSARYAGSAEAQPAVVALLAQRIREGGSGAWGVVAMPASPAVSPEESLTLARWVLEQRRP